MSYIGAEPTTAAFPFDQFSGTGAATSFTLTYAPAGTTSILVAISGVTQNPNLYSVIGTTLTFSPAPPAGTNNISVLYLGLPAVIGVPDVGSVTPAMLSTGGPSWNAGGTLSVAAMSDSGNLTFTGTGNRIIGDFSNATIANRVLFQTSTTNGNTLVRAIPNGTAIQANIAVANSSDADNCGIMQIVATSTEAQLASGINGTGTYLPMTFYTGGNEKVRVDTSGNVGIGTSSPTVKLDVAGGIKLSGQLMAGTSGSVYSPIVSAAYVAGTSNLYMRNLSGTNRIDSYNDPITATIPFQINASQQAFYIADAEKMRIDSSGNLLVGTTSSTIGGLNVNGVGVQRTGGDWQLLVARHTAATGGALINLSTGSTAGIGWDAGVLGSQTPWFWRYNAATVSSINPTSGAYSALSDARVKENVSALSNALPMIEALRPVRYSIVGDEAQEPQIGLIAQEVLEALPEVVSQPATEEGRYGLNYAGIVPVLVKAIQELKAEFDAYKEAHP